MAGKLKFNLTGMRFGRLSVIKPTSIEGKAKASYWECICDCGKVKIIQSNHLRRGTTRSCGCLQRESASEVGKRATTHGMTGTKMYTTWTAMVSRVTDTGSRSYPRYGGRGITIHPDWLNFDVFYRDMGEAPSEKHTVDRIDNEKGYGPGNCRWATSHEQARNRRTNRFVRIGDQVMCLADAAYVLGVRRQRISDWLKTGKLIEVERPAIQNIQTEAA